MDIYRRELTHGRRGTWTDTGVDPVRGTCTRHRDGYPSRRVRTEGRGGDTGVESSLGVRTTGRTPDQTHSGRRWTRHRGDQFSTVVGNGVGV